MPHAIFHSSCTLSPRVLSSALLIYVRLRSATLRNLAIDGVLGGKGSGSVWTCTIALYVDTLY